MQDQIDSLHRRDIKAIALNTPLSQNEMIILFDNIQFNAVKFLYVSPEKLQSAFIQEKIKQLNITLVAIDEAHCISEWGHDFRPSYLKLNILKELCPDANTIALTASATQKVLEDISEQLEINDSNLFRQSFRRENLAYQIFEVEDKISKIKQIFNKIKAPSIIYTNTRKETQKLSELLNKEGYKSTFYHGGLNNNQKKEAYDNWFSEKTPVIIATNAFGMGIDKPNIRVVIHVKIPNSIENYLQEAGRGGRDGKKAFSVTLLHKNDTALFIKNNEAQKTSIEFLKKIYIQLNQYFKLIKGELPVESFHFQLADFCNQYHFQPTKTYNAIKVLTTHGVISFTEGFQKKTTLKFITSSNNVLNYCEQHPSLDFFIKTVLRSYGGLFEDFITINEYNISKKLNLPYRVVVEKIKTLEKDGLVKYSPASNSATIQFLVPREDNRTINGIAKDIKNLQENKDFKATSLINFIENSKTCRSKQLLAYFEETEEKDCGICDVCLTKKRSLQKTNVNLKEKIVCLLEKKTALSSQEIVTLLKETEIAVLNTLTEMLEKNQIEITKENRYRLTKNN
jgi:ATP-dependent DNA helicase RecQ